MSSVCECAFESECTTQAAERTDKITGTVFLCIPVQYVHYRKYYTEQRDQLGNKVGKSILIVFVSGYEITDLFLFIKGKHDAK